MIDFLINIFSAFYNILPDSFIQTLDLLDKDHMNFLADFLNYLNWLVPFDVASKIMAIWLPCILVYYISSTARSIVNKIVKTFIDNL